MNKLKDMRLALFSYRPCIDNLKLHKEIYVAIKGEKVKVHNDLEGDYCKGALDILENDLSDMIKEKMGIPGYYDEFIKKPIEELKKQPHETGESIDKAVNFAMDFLIEKWEKGIEKRRSQAYWSYLSGAVLVILSFQWRGYREFREV